MILLRDDLGAVPDAIALARATFRTIRANLAWAFCYNLLAIPLAAFGFLNPLVAAATMTLMTLFLGLRGLEQPAAAPLRRPVPGMISGLCSPGSPSRRPRHDPALTPSNAMRSATCCSCVFYRKVECQHLP